MERACVGYTYTWYMVIGVFCRESKITGQTLQQHLPRTLRKDNMPIHVRVNAEQTMELSPPGPSAIGVPVTFTWLTAA